MSTKREKIIAKALEILKLDPKGIRYAELVRGIKNDFPEIPINTIHGTVWNLEAQLPSEVYKPAKGLFRHFSFKAKETGEEKEYAVTEVRKIREEDFYQPFADWLVNEVEDCNKAIVLGGSKFKDKWGTPDVIGKKESLRSDMIKAPTEIVSAEVKIDTKDLITAFGQACSYRLFSHKSYIVVPKDSFQEDLSKLDSLCLIFGIGLVQFDNTNLEDPHFEIKVRPHKQEPDMFYVNKYMKLIEKELFA